MTTRESICEPCCRGTVQSQGFSWCSDCEEILCITCDTSHRIGKLTISHSITNLQELPSLPKGTEVNINFCEKHPEKHLDAFCAFHDVLYCRTCVLESHRTCDQVVPVDDVSSDIKSSARVQDVSKAMSSLIRTYNTIIENRKQNKKLVNKQKADIKTALASFKQNVMKQIQLLEECLLSDLSQCRDAANLELDNQVQEVTQMAQRMLTVKNEFDFGEKYGSNNKFLVSEEEIRIQEILSKMKNFSLKYVKRDVDSIISSLAKISTVSKKCGIHYTACIQARAQFVPTFSLTPLQPIDLSIHGTSSVTGIEITDDNRLLLCDYHGEKILMYKEDGTFLRCQKLEGRPYHISIIPNKKQSVVTLTNKKYILVLDTDNLTVFNKINTEKGYYGVHVLKEISGFIVGGNGGLEIMSVDGKIDRAFPLPENCLGRFIVMSQGQKLLYTDSYKLRCINIINGTHVFDYASTAEARGIAEDKYGCLYIADKKHNNIHRISRDGLAIDIVLRQNHGIVSPLAIKFNHDYSRLYVGMDQNRYLAVFQCK